MYHVDSVPISECSDTSVSVVPSTSLHAHLSSTSSDPVFQSAQQQQSAAQILLNSCDGTNLVHELAAKPSSPSVATYDSLFPALPTDPHPPTSTQASVSRVRESTMSTVTQVFHISYASERRVSTPGVASAASTALTTEQQVHKRCVDVMQQTNTSIEFSLRHRDSSVTFVVSGRAKDIAHARRFLVLHFQTPVTHRFSVPRAVLGALLGKKGVNLRALEKNTGTRIQVQSSNTLSTVAPTAKPADTHTALPSDQVGVSITGPQENVDCALHRIRLLVEQSERNTRVAVDIPKDFHIFISGPNGVNVKRIQAEHAVKVNVPPPSVEDTKLWLAGEKENVLAVEKHIKQMYSQLVSTCSEVSVEVNKQQHKYILGPRGATITQIFETTGVYVIVPSAVSESERVRLRGPQSQLGAALTMVYDRANSVKLLKLSCPSWIHRHIIGKKGAVINKLTEDFDKVSVEFDSANDKILIEGDTGDAQKVLEILEKMIVDLKERFCILTVHIPDTLFSHIIGKGGVNINRLCSKHSVSISFQSAENSASAIGGTSSKRAENKQGEVVKSRQQPRAVSAQGPLTYTSEGSVVTQSTCLEPVTIEGTRTGVADVAREIQQMVERLRDEIVMEMCGVEQSSIRVLIGPKGDNISTLRAKFPSVQINLPRADSDSSTIKLRGPSDQVKLCHEHLTSFVQQIVKSSYTERVCVDDIQNVGFIIGKSGANLARIREQNGVRIDVQSPADGVSVNKNTYLLVIGEKDKVKKAVKSLNELQSQLENIVQRDIIISSKHHTSLIGSNGRVIRSILSECGGSVTIQFPAPDSNSEKVTIRGPLESVNKAKTLLLDMANEREECTYSKQFRIKPEYYTLLIGKKGCKLDDIRQQTSVRFVLPDNVVTDGCVTLIGKKSNVHKALGMLEEWNDSMVTEKIAVESEHASHFRMNKYQVLNELNAIIPSVNVSITWAREAGERSAEIVIRGEAPGVTTVNKRVCDIIHNLKQIKRIELTVPSRYHGQILGAKGTNINMINRTYDVTVNFGAQRVKSVSGKSGTASLQTELPTTSEETEDLLYITGLMENCMRAKQAILDMIPVTEYVHVPVEFHAALIGRNGTQIRDMMRTHNVAISVSPSTQLAAEEGGEGEAVPQTPSGGVRVNGHRECVKRACEAISLRVKQFAEERLDYQLRTFQLRLYIEAQYHSRVIGARGSIINPIKKKFGVFIHFPNQQPGDKSAETNSNVVRADNEVSANTHSQLTTGAPLIGAEEGVDTVSAADIILITGYEEKARAAASHLLEMVRRLQNQVTEYVNIQPEVHARMIGVKRRNIRKFNQQYKVDVRFPPVTSFAVSAKPNHELTSGASCDNCTETEMINHTPCENSADNIAACVTVIGDTRELVDAAISALREMEHEYLVENLERLEMQSMIRSSTTRPRFDPYPIVASNSASQHAAKKTVQCDGFVVINAPWDVSEKNGQMTEASLNHACGPSGLRVDVQSSLDFPSIGQQQITAAVVCSAADTSSVDTSTWNTYARQHL